MRQRVALLTGIAFLLGMTALGGLSWARKEYSGVCGKLDGIPGMLQAASLLRPSGGCAVKGDGRTCANPGSQCIKRGDESGETEKGSCRQRGRGRNATCQCGGGGDDDDERGDR